MYCLQQHRCENLKSHNRNSILNVPDRKISNYSKLSYKVLCPYKPLGMDCLKINTLVQRVRRLPLLNPPPFQCELLIDIFYVLAFVILSK
jgi:hypothetical protein